MPSRIVASASRRHGHGRITLVEGVGSRHRGERYRDVIVFWVESDLEKEAILADASLPFFTTSHFDGHSSVLLRGSRVGEMSRDELAGFIEGAWLSRAGSRAIAKWMREQGAR